MATRGTLARALARKKKSDTYFDQVNAKNTVQKGAGSQRKGKGYRIGFSHSRRRFFHDYGGSTGRVYIRRSNPLTARYQSRFGVRVPGTDMVRSGSRGSSSGGARAPAARVPAPNSVQVSVPQNPLTKKKRRYY